MSQAQLTDDERALIALAQDIEMMQEERMKWATLVENIDHGPSEQIAENFRDAWEDMIKDADEQAQELEVDQEMLRQKLTGGQGPMPDAVRDLGQ